MAEQVQFDKHLQHYEEQLEPEDFVGGGSEHNYTANFPIYALSFSN
jgi:hypothetical protein